MTTSRAALAAAALQVPTILHFIVSAYIGAVQPSGALLALLVRIDGVLSGGLYLFCFIFICLSFAVGRPKPQVRPLTRAYLRVAAAALCYFGAVLLLSVAAGNAPGYTIGDAYRALLPFITLVVLFAVYPGDEEFRDRFVDIYVALVVVIAIAGAAFKTVYTLSGMFYGSGLQQYSVGVFLFTYLLLRITHRSYAFGRSVLWVVLLFIMLALSVLSLKRGTWVSLAFAGTLVLLISERRTRAAAFLFTFIASGWLAAERLGVADLLVGRLMDTFEGERVVDSSTFERIAEGAGVMYTLDEVGSPLVYFTGLGHGAEFRADPSFPMRSEDGGSAPGLFHHVHITPFLMLFRYGVIGGILYLLLAIPALLTARRLLSRRFRSHVLHHRRGQLYVASLISLSTTLLLGLKGNIMYGSTGFALLVFVLVGSYEAAIDAFDRSEAPDA